jgi:hypothetical protein
VLNKTPVNINFSQGLDLKTDPFQVQVGKFLSLQNSIFDKAGLLAKRNGFGPLSALPDTSNTILTTFNDNLTAIGTTLNAYSQATSSWVNKGAIQPISLSTLPLIRSSTNQSQADSAVATNGLVCTAFTDNVVAGAQYKYAVADSVTGQNIVAPTLIPASGGGTITGSPRVFIVGAYFIVVFTNVITATSHLQFLAISTSNPTATPITGEIDASYVSATTVSWDGVSYSNTLYIAYNTTSGGQSIKLRTLSNNLVVSAAKLFVGEICTMMSMTVDSTNPASPVIWAAYYDAAGSTGKAFAVDPSLGTLLAPTTIIATGTYLNITCTAKSSILTFLVEESNNYSYDSGIPTHLIKKNTLTESGTLGTPSTLVRSVGLASKAILYSNSMYFLATYQSAYQPTYFLINASGQVISKVAYSNGGGYLTKGLPAVSINNAVLQIPYLIKDLIAGTNKAQGAANSAPVYSQTGINLSSFDMVSSQINTKEIGSNLNLTGGFIAGYDGYSVTEQNFFLWPDSVEVTTSGSGGLITAQQYYYVATYEWADNAGNVFRSAPSIPVTVTTTGSTSTNTINVPTLRLTYKTANPVKLVVYRWSAAQQTYYAIQPPSAAPILNSVTTDSIAFTDTAADSAILGNPILYTTGGVIENVAPPASNIMTLWNNRLWLVDAEDTNLLWYSKQVIEATPVEMSDLLTLYIAPTTASQRSTGPVTALSPMDDKLVVFKSNALGYFTGIGPDNTGSNSSYSDFTLINSVVGCTNQKSIVFIPSGLMFQSDKGIWLLGRDLSTTYIGAPVESLTQGATVLSAVNVPGTNQVRLTLDTGITLMYDYYFQQWGTFVNIPAVSSTVYNELHTYIDSLGRVFQETPGVYLDNSSPVLMSFTTGWLNLAGVQGYERFYFMYLLGTYITPFKLNVQLAYDYNPSITQSTIVTPDASSITPAWGGDPTWGSSTPWGGAPNVFESRIFPQKQKCESFQVSISEIYDPSYGIMAGAGLTLSGMNLIVGIKKGYRTQSSARSFG